MTFKHTVTDLSTGAKHEFVGERNDERALKKFLSLERADWETDKVEVCPACGQQVNRAKD